MAKASARPLRLPLKTTVAPAAGRGRGVFAIRAHRRGETIERAPALLIPTQEVQEMLCTFLGHYIFRTDTGRRYVIGLGFTSLYNHSSKPNAEFSVTRDTIEIRAIRAIAVGDEIVVDYGWTKREWADAGGCIP